MNTSRVIYEFPITNRVRSFLRFEHLIDKMEASIDKQDNPLTTIQILHQLLELIRHNDVKSELIRHIRWQEQELQKFSDSSPVDQNKLEKIMKEKQEIIRELDDFVMPMSDYMNNHFLSSTKLRLSIPGGTCGFDLPELHAWLHFDNNVIIAELRIWFEPFQQLQRALKSTLGLIRTSAEFIRETAESGYYISDFPPRKHAYCLIRISVEDNPKIHPEVSSGPRHFTVYFFEIANLKTRPCQTRQNVQFELARCTL